MNIAVRRVEWRPSWRIIPSRFPPIPLFERVSDAADLDAVFALEALTNPRLRQEVGDLHMVPPDQRVSGPGSSVIMAAFTHLNPQGSRFSDGSFGVFYTARSLDTAIAETKYHRQNFMAATQQAPMSLDMRVYVVDLEADLHDIRGRQRHYAALYDGERYGASQDLAKALRADGATGLVYDSVRHDGGECAALFTPVKLSNSRQERHLCYLWDGHCITAVYEKREI